jgi:Ca-activated chloride channel family protein
VNVRLVTVVATVSDTNGRYVANLRSTDFAVEEDGRRQDIVHFSQDSDIPISLGIVLDTSQSMDGRMRAATDAVKRFIRNTHPDDDIFLMTFSSAPALKQDFTNNRRFLSRALDAVRPSGGTALYDAVKESLKKVREGRHDKRAILVITDGLDTSSDSTAESVLLQIRRSELLVYSIGIGEAQRSTPPFNSGPFSLPPGPGGQRPLPSQRSSVNMSVLRRFADNSGGHAVLLPSSGSSRKLDETLEQIASELRSQYTLGYYPTSLDAAANNDDGRFHSLRVRTRNGYVVRARTGYVAAGN